MKKLKKLKKLTDVRLSRESIRHICGMGSCEDAMRPVEQQQTTGLLGFWNKYINGCHKASGPFHPLWLLMRYSLLRKKVTLYVDGVERCACCYAYWYYILFFVGLVIGWWL